MPFRLTFFVLSVAAAGLPDPRDDHAIVIARFARDCLMKMQEVVNVLEFSLGYVHVLSFIVD